MGTADVEALGTVLYGALTAAALTIARAEDERRARNILGRRTIELLKSLRPSR
ncbi:hypothetical protein [Nocardia miyunensis]|uniref:hypothetical protein n=1 Tax=Nocardia miyunensis TaxID=282684 RepID=UPI00350E4454